MCRSVSCEPREAVLYLACPKSCHRSRHVDRRFFKVRELEALGIVKVEHVPTALNRADVLTKAVDKETFLRHRASLMNVQG